MSIATARTVDGNKLTASSEIGKSSAHETITDACRLLLLCLDGERSGGGHAPSRHESRLRVDAESAEYGNCLAKIDFTQLPRVTSKHAMISDVRDRGGNWMHQYAYLAHHDGRYWAIWSDGPGKRRSNLTPEQHRNVVPGHDQPGTRMSYSTSKDGLHWSKPADLTGPPRIDGFGWIARGLWIRDGELLALVSHFNAPGYPGKGLSLEAFLWNKATDAC